jgi:hypothetical protein
MKKVVIFSLGAALLLLGACGIIPGTGMYASQVVDRFINTRFTNPRDPERNEVGSFYSKVAQGQTWLYRTEREGAGTRYYILYYYERCKYSLYVDENDIIRSWRDESGRDHMKSCLLH